MLVTVRYKGQPMTSAGTNPPMTELETERQGLWTTKEVSAFLRVSRSRVYHQAEAGLIPGMRVGSLLRYEPDAIRRFARGEWKPANVIEMAKKGSG